MSLPTEVLNLTRTLIETANALVTRYKVATEDKGKAVDTLFQTSEDASVVKARTFVEDLDSKREAAIQKAYAYIRENLITDALSPEQVESLKGEVKEAQSAAKEGIKFATLMNGKVAPDGLPDLMGIRASSTAGGATGIRRPRLSMITVDGKEVSGSKEKDGVTTVTHTFTDLAAYLKKESGESVKGSDLRAAAFEAAGTEDLSEKAGQAVTFTTTLKGQTYTVVVTPADAEAAPDKE